MAASLTNTSRTQNLDLDPMQEQLIIYSTFSAVKEVSELLYSYDISYSL